MKLSREEYVAICETCVKRDFDPKFGLVCSLTKAYANFDTTCENFEQDPSAIKRIDRIKNNTRESAVNNAEAGSIMAFIGNNNSNSTSIGSGIAITVGGLAWLIIGLFLNRLFFYPIFLIMIGIAVLAAGIVKKSKKKLDTANVLDDKNDLEVL
jgi:hypothetical protein